jgi:hypothetical protein
MPCCDHIVARGGSIHIVDLSICVTWMCREKGGSRAVPPRQCFVQ